MFDEAGGSFDEVSSECYHTLIACAQDGPRPEANVQQSDRVHHAKNPPSGNNDRSSTVQTTTSSPWIRLGRSHVIKIRVFWSAGRIR